MHVLEQQVLILFSKLWVVNTWQKPKHIVESYTCTVAKKLTNKAPEYGAKFYN